jgi:hypothetical protein
MPRIVFWAVCKLANPTPAWIDLDFLRAPRPPREEKHHEPPPSRQNQLFLRATTDAAPPEVDKIFDEVARAVGVAHELGVVHRDI